jgi:hypothetical protein
MTEASEVQGCVTKTVSWSGMSALISAVSRRRRVVCVIALACLLPALAAPRAVAATPYIQLAPTMINQGQTLTVYGRGFCAGQRCSRVVVNVGSSRAASGVRVHANGRFVVAFVFSYVGHYIINAVQTAANHSRLVATAPITVGQGDIVGGATATTLTRKPGPSAPSATRAKAKPPTTKARVPPTPQGPSKVGGGTRPANGGKALAGRDSGSSGWSLGAIVAVAAGGLLGLCLLLRLGPRARRRARRANA